MTPFEQAAERTDAKIRYALLMFEELAKNPEIGGADDFERAHQEAFLFHFLGILDALLKELRIRHNVQISSRNLKTQALKGHGVTDAQTIIDLEDDSESWLSKARALRNYFTHEDSVPKVLHYGGENHRKVFFRDILTGRVIELDHIELFAGWLEQMIELVSSLRPDAIG